MEVIEALRTSILEPRDHLHIKQNRMRRRGRWGSPGGGAGPREVDARYIRGISQVDQGHRLGRQVAVVLAWPANANAPSACGVRVSGVGGVCRAVSVWGDSRRR